MFIPIVSNGVYEASVSMEGYISYSTSYEVAIDSGECDVLAPVVLLPLTKRPADDCVSLSLTWDEEPQDLDLYSYRYQRKNYHWGSKTKEKKKHLKFCPFATRS